MVSEERERESSLLCETTTSSCSESSSAAKSENQMRLAIMRAKKKNSPQKGADPKVSPRDVPRRAYTSLNGLPFSLWDGHESLAGNCLFVVRFPPVNPVAEFSGYAD